MARVTVQDLANVINADCDRAMHFWAYGLIRETLPMWQTAEHRQLLCSAAQTMVDQCNEIQNEEKSQTEEDQTHERSANRQDRGRRNRRSHT